MIGATKKPKAPPAYGPVKFREMGTRETVAFGTVQYVRAYRESGHPISWSTLWEAFSKAYPNQWAVQMFPSARYMVNDLNIYHLFIVPEEMVGGLNIMEGWK